jgi:hypothetical protein
MQAEALLREDIGKGGDFCGLVVDLAVEVANTVVLASFSAAKQVGLEVIISLQQDLILTADSACSVAHRGMQQLLEGEVASMDSSSTIDLSEAAAERPSGALPLDTHAMCTADTFCRLFLCAAGYAFCVNMQAISSLFPRSCTFALLAVRSSPHEQSCTSNLLTAHCILVPAASWPLPPELKECSHKAQ